MRSSQRLSITLPHFLFEALVRRSDAEGRSLSNLAAYLLESSLSGVKGPSALPMSSGSRPQPKGTSSVR
ncbi:ribbon-helix-helix domain-containing protein [Synechococcus sp. W4D4]|nr:hypothetical protein [Synechococcus sp. A10-1-5-1]